MADATAMAALTKQVRFTVGFVLRLDVNLVDFITQFEKERAERAFTAAIWQQISLTALGREESDGVGSTKLPLRKPNGGYRV